MKMVAPTYTYIVKTKEGEYYCGKTSRILERIKEHHAEKRPHWFGFKKRKIWDNIFICKGDHEKKIKSFGVKRFYNIKIQYVGLPS